MYGALLPYVHAPRRSQLPDRHDGSGDRHRSLVRARRRHARGAVLAGRPARGGLRHRCGSLQDRAHLRHRELEPRSARAARRAGRGRVGRRLHPDDQRRGAEGTRQHLPPAGRHREPSDGVDREQQAGAGGCAAGDGGAGGKRAGPAHARLGGIEPAPGGQAVERSAGVRVPAEHQPARVSELQPLLLRATGQEGRDRGRALQRRWLGGRLHHRRAATRFRRLLQQRGRRPRALHQPRGRASGARR